MVNVLLEEKLLQDGGFIKPEQIGVVDHFQLGGQIHVDAKIGQEETGVDEVALSLGLARAQVRQKTAGLNQVDAEKLDLLPLPVAELAAGKVRIVEDGVEAGGVAVGDVAVAGGKEKRGAEAHPV